jgi:hypothetical protein
MAQARAIDHLVLCVADLDRAKAVYERLGFTTTPRASHPWGTGNSLVQLQGNFIELLGVDDPSKIAPTPPGHFSFGAFNDAFLKLREGFSMLVFASTDARADRAAFAAAGLQTYAPFDFSRRARLPDGGEATVSFSLAFATDPRMPEAAFFVCQQHAPQYFWKPEYQRHANRALAIDEAVMVADRPDELTDFFERLQGPGAVACEGDMLHIRAGTGAITVMTPGAFAMRFGGAHIVRAPNSPYLAAYRVRVADIELCARTMSARGAVFSRVGKALYIAPGDAFNVALEVVAG